MSLLVTDVGYEYGAGTAYRQTAVDGVSLTVEVGQLAVVLGGTGSGKSTLLRLCAGLLKPSRGEVHVDASIVGEGAAGANVVRTGIVFQNPESQLFAETVMADVEFGPRNLGLDDDASREAAERSLVAVGLDPSAFGSRSPFSLSGGEARRAAIAGVIAMEPEYLLLDEPTAGLDASGRDAICRAIERARERAGVVVVTHDPEEFVAMADTVLVLEGGRQVFGGAPSDLLARSSALVEAGLGVPDVLAAQLLAIGRGLALPHLTLDPVLAADNIAAAREGAR